MLLRHNRVKNFSSARYGNSYNCGTMLRSNRVKNFSSSSFNNNSSVTMGRLLKPSIFAASFTLGTMAFVPVYTYESRKSMVEYVRGKNPWRVPQSVRNVIGREYAYSIERFANNPDNTVIAAILGINAAVFLCWQLPFASRLMTRYFLHDPSSSRSLPMLLSTFSHSTLMHFGFNMYAFHSFASTAVYMFGGSQNFLAYYLSAGVLASYGSLIARNLGSRAMMLPSLGASGAVLFLASTVAFKNPQTELGLIFLPGVSFPAETMIMLVMCADVAGLLLGWRTFDHAAHLVGASLGFLVAKTDLYYRVSQYQRGCVDIWVKLKRKLG
jgi:rhomboid-like protein